MSQRSQKKSASIWINLMHKLAAVVATATCAVAAAQPQSADTDIPTKHQTVHGYLMLEGVNTRTGNFARTYPAFERHALAYRRTYNSNATNHGTFGHAWGTGFDTQAVALPDGRVAVLENGNGAITVYGHGALDETQLAMEQAVAAAQNHPVAPRTDIGATLSIESPFAQSQAADCVNALLVVVRFGYVRTTCAGRVEIFDTQGRMVSYTSLNSLIRANRNEPMVHVTRDASGRILAVRDDEGHRLVFTRTTKALKVTNEASDWVQYTFDAQGRNTAITGKNEPAYTFDYDTYGLMRQINYIDTTSIKIDYVNGRTSRMTLREGDVFEFDYLPENQTRITSRPNNGKPSRQVIRFLD